MPRGYDGIDRGVSGSIKTLMKCLWDSMTGRTGAEMRSTNVECDPDFSHSIYIYVFSAPGILYMDGVT